MDSELNVSHLGAHQLDQAVDALVSAFEQDPIKVRLSADSGRRKKLLFGFEVVHCEHLHRLDLPIWFMKRDS